MKNGYKALNEKWKTVQLYPSYMISNYGRVKNERTGKSLKILRLIINTLMQL